MQTKHEWLGWMGRAAIASALVWASGPRFFRKGN
jgi:hypothetical protein